METNLEEGDIVLCTVDRIIGTNVFVKIPYEGKELEGTLTFSEISPGRIRNIRDYVVPKKIIVCKILRISGDRIDLTFRRVTQEERKKTKEKAKEEKSYEKILKGILGEKGNSVAKEISEKEKIYTFLERAKENPKELEKLIGKSDTKKVMEIINSQKKNKSIIKKYIRLTSLENDGLDILKKLFKDTKGIEIKYLSSGEYSLKKESEDLKKLDKEFDIILKKLEEKAKKEGIQFQIVKNKH
ncbi:MAG: hypothetical protein WDZ62_00930 [Candidatus Pacearchaeota archaeon]